MRVVFRVDASDSIGSGHVMRCLTLADTLRKSGAETAFVTRAHKGHLATLIKARGHTVHLLPGKATAVFGDDPYAAWLGADRNDDAIETGAAIEAYGLVDWLIVDHYAIDVRWEATLRDYARRIMVIDDLANRKHDCDLLLDQNLVADASSRYLELIPSEALRLLGPAFALLQPEYAEQRKALPERMPTGQVSVFFGGSDLPNMTALALDAIVRLDQDWPVTVVIGQGNPHSKEIAERVERLENANLVTGLSSLANLFFNSEIAIGAAGATTLERLCMGVPSVVVTLAENQLESAKELARRGLATTLGNWKGVTAEHLAEAIHGVLPGLRTQDERLRLSEHVDGLGVARVLNALAGSVDQPFLREASWSDERFLLNLANDPAVRCQSFDARKIDEQQHAQWFKTRLAKPSHCRIFIAENSAAEHVGYVRFEHSDEAWELSYAIGHDFRGRGLARPMLLSGLRRLQLLDGRCTVRAKVKSTNLASLRSLVAAGFSDLGEDDGDGIKTFVAHC